MLINDPKLLGALRELEVERRPGVRLASWTSLGIGGTTDLLIVRERRYLPDLTSDNRQRREMAERMALNAPIQGSAADIIKVAMLGVDRALRARGLRSRMLLQVHDELLFEVAPGELDDLRELVTQTMCRAFELDVPLEVSIGTGHSWAEAGH